MSGAGSFDGNVAKAQQHVARLRVSGVQHFIDGAARPAMSGQTFETRTPLDESVLAKVAAGDAQFRLFEAVAACLRGLSEGRFVTVLIDDLQWADEGTLRLLSFVNRAVAGSGVLVVGEDALARLLDGHLEAGVEQHRDVGRYDGGPPLGVAGLGPDPHMDGLHAVRMPLPGCRVSAAR